MTPDHLARNDTEHGHQRALFAWLNFAGRYGFAAANDDLSYSVQGHAAAYGTATAVPGLLWAFAIPNGGSRGDNKLARQIRGAQLKAEGVKPGVPDLMVPVPCWHKAGLFIEMKRPNVKAKKQRAGVVAIEQEPYHVYLRANHYAVVSAWTWRQAADAIEMYVASGVEKQGHP